MQLLNHQFITKNQLPAFDNNAESDYESNPLENKLGPNFHRKNSSKVNFEKQDPAGLGASQGPQVQNIRKKSDWSKNPKEAKRRDQPFEMTASAQTADKALQPKPKKKIQITEQNAEKDTISAEILEMEKFKLAPGAVTGKPGSEEAKETHSKFRNTPLELSGVVKNPKAWLVSQAITAESVENNSQARSGKHEPQDEIPEEPEQADLRSNYQGLGHNEIGGSSLHSRTASVYNYDKVQEAEAAQKKLLEEMMLDVADKLQEARELQPQAGPSPHKLTMSEIDREQKLLLEDMWLAQPDRPATGHSFGASPENPLPATVSQIEAQQLRLLEEMMEPVPPVALKKRSTDEKYLADQPGAAPSNPLAGESDRAESSLSSRQRSRESKKNRGCSPWKCSATLQTTAATRRTSPRPGTGAEKKSRPT